MFALHSRRLRRRLSAPTSGSLRRRVRERQIAERTRLDGESIARERNELTLRQKLESQYQARQELATYAPWGREGGGAPNARGVRFTDIRSKEIYPEDELRGVQLSEGSRYWGSSPLHRRRPRQTPLRIREDPQCYYAENLRKSVDNDIRYRQTPMQHKCYKEILDEMVKKRQKALHDDMRWNLEYEQKMHQMESPWGKPGPGGTTWRNPRNIGLNFSKSMGWTDNEILDKMNEERQHPERSSLTLPQVKRDDDYYEDYLREKENVQFSSAPDKLPNITHSNSAKENERGEINHRSEINERREMNPGTVAKGKGKRSPIKSKHIKRLPSREAVKLTYPEDLYEKYPKDEESLNRSEKKPTPEESILRATGGIELVPLLARRRRVGARTLPSSDVTRPPEQSCQWREMIDAEYLSILKHQMKAKCQQKEESRQNSAESVRRHHETWASLWGRPGHGAPQQRGRYARSNLARLLYVTPLAHHKNDQYF